MTLARHRLTGLVEDLRDEILDHPELGKWFDRITGSKKPLVSYQVGTKVPIEETDAPEDAVKADTAEPKPVETVEPATTTDQTFGDAPQPATETN